MKEQQHIIYCQSNTKGNSYLAFGVEDELVLKSEADSFSKLDKYISKKNSWIFGYLSYDLKNDIEHLYSKNKDCLSFPEMIFFRPKVVLSIEGNNHSILHNSNDYSKRKIDEIVQRIINPEIENRLEIYERVKRRTSKNDYLKNAKDILSHIHRGDIYELNYCQEFYIEHVEVDPWQSYLRLNELTKAPYSTYFRWEDFYIMSGSPELFLERKGNKIISKPIKGTIKRGENKKEDDALKLQLKNDQKELSENVMIVDIVRNDLSRTAIINSVKVPELCEIYSFETVHQMISTVESEVEENKSNVEILKHAFPMGSMTGAPKIRAMKLIEEYENFKRGVYSGAVGFFEPSGNFTFNVIIRSIIYNAKKRYCSMPAGGAITSLSDPEKEYEESLLKASSMFKSIVSYEK